MVGGIDPGATAVEPRLGMRQFAIDHPLRASRRAKGHGVDTGRCGSRQIAEVPCGREETALAWIDIAETDPPIVGIWPTRGGEEGKIKEGASAFPLSRSQPAE